LTQFIVTFEWQENGICVLNDPQIFHGWTGLVALGLLIFEVALSHRDTLHSIRLLSKSDRPLAETGTRQRI